MLHQANFETGSFSCLDFIEDAIIDIPERRTHYFRKTIAVLTDDIDAGLQSCFLGMREQTGRPCPELCIRLVHSIEQQQITKMKNPRFGF